MIDINRIIEKAGLDFTEVARLLFPHTKHPVKALQRTSQGQGSLNEKQISKLALLADMPVAELFSAKEWKGASKSGFLTLETEGYKAELDSNTFNLKVFSKDSLIHESVLLKEGISLSNLIELIESIINQ